MRTCKEDKGIASARSTCLYWSFESYWKLSLSGLPYWALVFKGPDSVVFLWQCICWQSRKMVKQLCTVVCMILIAFWRLFLLTARGLQPYFCLPTKLDVQIRSSSPWLNATFLLAFQRWKLDDSLGRCIKWRASQLSFLRRRIRPCLEVIAQFFYLGWTDFKEISPRLKRNFVVKIQRSCFSPWRL